MIEPSVFGSIYFWGNNLYNYKGKTMWVYGRCSGDRWNIFKKLGEKWKLNNNKGGGLRCIELPYVMMKRYAYSR